MRRHKAARVALSAGLVALFMATAVRRKTGHWLEEQRQVLVLARCQGVDHSPFPLAGTGSKPPSATLTDIHQTYTSIVDVARTKNVYLATPVFAASLVRIEL